VCHIRNAERRKQRCSTMPGRFSQTVTRSIAATKTPIDSAEFPVE
jgi:hypothetical protein